MVTTTGPPEKTMSSEQVDLANSVASVDANKQGRAIELENAGVESRLHEEKKIRRKVDRRLLPMCGALYAVSLIDRLNLPNARLAGMDEALGISIGSRYSIITMVFFIGYILFDFPANFVIRQTGAATFLGTIGFLWGILTIGMGFCKTWGELLLCRIIFGALEGGLFPGIIYLLSCWYIRHEVQVRFSSFYGFGMLISGLSNLIAYGLSKADGLGGLGGWSWIFIFEGIATCVVAAVVLVFCLDFPDQAARPRKLGFRSFLTPSEVTVILDRIERDRGDATPEKFTFKSVLGHLKDWKIWEYCLLLLCNNTVAYSFAYFLPLILHGEMGFSIYKTYVLIFPSYVLAAIWMFTVAYFGDRFMIRGPIIVGNALLTITGVVMMGYAKTSAVRYAGVFLALAPYNASIPCIFSYQHNNIIGQSKRAIGAAVMIAGAGVGGIIASNAFQQKDAPGYRPGLNTVIAVQALTVVIVCKNFFVFTRANRKADRGEIVIEGREGFRYTL